MRGVGAGRGTDAAIAYAGDTYPNRTGGGEVSSLLAALLQQGATRTGLPRMALARWAGCTDYMDDMVAMTRLCLLIRRTPSQ